ncbi:MAG: hydroxyacid dehydrogenase [Flavobacteriaceae bacterium]|nr:2-hydroxyacid dehydrogenase [Bacteroidia bacterium]MBT8288875.1 2-hydroxyacid dehydrogenase [Bacteroidia bacterium]NNF74398.1 hydroxyacid dehydrogenase [Flavobacteriaceae bacterium]NNK72559.1 hydroxyacid dehydrogenase [Flavobacteriaceae bacterium]
MRILHLDTNHPLLIEQLNQLGYENYEDYQASKEDVQKKLDQFEGIVIRSRFKIDRSFIQAGRNLKFIARVGSGLENIDLKTAEENGILVFGAPEGNCNAVGEHAVGLLLNLMNHIKRSDSEVRHGLWYREANRGHELQGKTIGLIGYGHTGKAFARKLSGFDARIICNDIKPDMGDKYAEQVTLQELQQQADIISLHVPLTDLTLGMINAEFIANCSKSFWLINTARGKNVITADLVNGLKSGKVRGAGLDVLEYEKSSFETLNNKSDFPEPFQYLIRAENVILTPHVAGWTVESKQKLAQVIVDKIKAAFVGN